MPGLTALTYRTLRLILDDTRSIALYTNINTDLRDPAFFAACYETLDKIEDIDTYLLTPEKYQQWQDEYVPAEILTIMFYPYLTMTDTLRDYVPLGRRATANQTPPRIGLLYEAKRSGMHVPPSGHFFTRVLDATKHERTRSNLIDFRMYYSSYAFWHYRVLASHYVSTDYAHEFINRPGWTSSPVLETQGMRYIAEENVGWRSYSEREIHKECCRAVSTSLLFRYYIGPFTLKERPNEKGN